MPRNLIITTIGDGNVIDTWFDRPDDRDFDLFAIDFRPGPRTAPRYAEYFVQRAGFKFALLDFVAREHATELSRYERIWCPDDDIALDTQSINTMFRLFAEYRLQLAQPAIGDGDVSFQSFRPVDGAVLRYAPFVEIMCPLLTRESFFRLSDTFAASRSGWGLDFVWPLRFQPRAIAILDRIRARHTRPLASGEMYARFKRLGIDPWNETAEVVRRFGGVSQRTIRRMVFGKQRMPTVYEPGYQCGLWRNLLDRVTRRAA